MKILTERVYSLTAAAEREMACDVNEKTVLYLFRSRHRAQFDGGNGQGEDLRAPRRKLHHRWRRAFALRGRVVRDTSFQGIAKCDVDIRKKPPSAQTETSSLLALNVSVALKCVPSQASLVTKASGVHDISFWSNMKCDVHIRKEFCANVVSSSGTN